MMAMMLLVTAVMMTGLAVMHDLARAQLETDEAARCVEAGLALNAERLERDRVVRPADQQIAAAADADLGVAADATVVAGQVATADAAGRGVHGPREVGALGDADIKAETGDGRDVRLRTTAPAGEHAIELRGRSNHHADVLAAVAFEKADLRAPFLRIRGGERCENNGGSSAEQIGQSHEIVSNLDCTQRRENKEATCT
jgi:hypothetical protein